MDNKGFFTATFNIDIAKKYGTDAAIMLSNIHYWCKKNKANRKNFHNGAYWSYSTREAFSELFPYLTVRQIDTILTNLKKDGLIKVDNFNPKKYDKTLWYTVDETLYNAYLTTISPNGNMDVTDSSHGSNENVAPIPNTKQIVNTDNISCATSYTFELFWEDYGVKKNKHEAQRKFNKLSPKEKNHIQTIMPQYKKDTPEVNFRKHPTTFLNQKTWLDYDETEVKTTSSTTTKSETKEQRYNTLLERIKQKPFDENRFTIDERRFMILYQSETDRFPPDDRKMISEMTSLTREEQNIKDAQRWTI